MKKDIKTRHNIYTYLILMRDNQIFHKSPLINSVDPFSAFKYYAQEFCIPASFFCKFRMTPLTSESYFKTYRIRGRAKGFSNVLFTVYEFEPMDDNLLNEIILEYLPKG